MSDDLLWANIQEIPYFRGMLRAVEGRLMRQVKLTPPIIDIGCGDGHFASATYDFKINVGIDPEPGSLREAKGRGSYESLVQSFGADLPFPSGTFASGISNSVLEHIQNLEPVLRELNRVLVPNAPFAFTVPNPGYREQLGIPRILKRVCLHRLADLYRDWFMEMSRTYNLFHEDGWRDLLNRTGFHIIRSKRYFSPNALRALEYGHYLGAPTLIPRMLTGKWILSPSRWNLSLTEKWARKFTMEEALEDGTYCFYLAQKM
jgi:SAM-dependent methyltransferase